jgi:hypothetical protein
LNSALLTGLNFFAIAWTISTPGLKRYSIYAGAKLAPFNSGGVCQNFPAKTDNALQQIFISGHYFPKNVGDWGGGWKKVFPDSNKIFPGINQLN